MGGPGALTRRHGSRGPRPLRQAVGGGGPGDDGADWHREKQKENQMASKTRCAEDRRRRAVRNLLVPVHRQIVHLLVCKAGNSRREIAYLAYMKRFP